MNLDNDRHLELEISRELKALPELTAPATVANRVLAALKLRLNVPWYRRSWVTWPLALRMASLAAMLALFGGLCLAGWEISRTETIVSATHRAGQWFSGLNTIGSVLNILAGSAALVVKKLGTTFIVACLVAACLGYAIFLGLGTVYFRLAFTKR
jgi:hypothetical protein